MVAVSIRAKIALMAFIAVGLSGMSTTLVWYALERNSETVRQLVRVEYPTLEIAASNQSLMQQASERFNMAVTTGDQDVLQEGQRALTQINDNLDRLRMLLPADKTMLETLKGRVTTYFQQANRLAIGMINGNIDFAVAASDAQENNALLEQILTQMEARLNKQAAYFEGAVGSLQQQNNATAERILYLCLLGALILLSMGAYLAQTTRANLAMVANKMREISSGDGDLTQRLVYQQQDELQPLVEHFNHFIETLHHNIKSTVDNIGALQGIANNLTSAKDQTLNLSHRQLEGMDEVARAVSQMSEAAQNIAQNANDTAGAVSVARQQSQEGNGFVLETIEAMHNLVADVQKASTVVDQLNRSTQSAASILNSINAIAEQTNLLALNAAIEAARAGEQGRGFAVVADEVRTLAFRTQSSTKEIQDVLETLQKQANEAMDIINCSVNNAEQCTEKSSQAEQALEQVQLHVADVDERNTCIAAATEEQGQMTLQIEHHLQQLTDLSQETVASIDVVDTVATQLGQIQSNLSGITTQFKVSNS